MYRFFLRLFFFTSLSILTMVVRAQENLKEEKPQMADGMRSNGKIYVVVMVLVIILAGIFGYLIHLDRKIKRLEKSNP
jgi:CcmD family protein